MSNEPYRALQWAEATLTGDATFMAFLNGGIWRGLAPQGTLTPYAVLWIQSAPVLLTWNRRRAWTDVLFGLKVVAEASKAVATDGAMARADVLLNLGKGSGGAASGGTTQNVIGCAEESALDLEEIVNNVLWSSPGALYRAHVA